MDESVLTRTFEMLVERLGRVEAQVTSVMDHLRHQDDERSGVIHGPTHGFPGEIRKHYTGPVSDNDCVLVDFVTRDTYPTMAFCQWLADERALPEALTAALEAAPGTAEMRKMIDDDRGVSMAWTCGELGLAGAPAQRSVHAQVATRLAQSQGALYVDDDMVLLRGPATISGAMGSFNEVLKVCGVEPGQIHGPVQLYRLSAAEAALYVELNDRDLTAASARWHALPPAVRRRVLGSEPFGAHVDALGELSRHAAAMSAVRRV